MFIMRNQQFDQLRDQLSQLNEHVRRMTYEFSDVVHELRRIDHTLDRISHELASLIPFSDVQFFTVTQVQGDSTMPLVPIAPGSSPQFTATPEPAGVQLNPATPPTWTSSDTTNAPVTVDLTGLVATVAIPATATVGASATLTISYTNADGKVATGSITITIVAAVTDVTGFTVVQSA